MRFRVRIAYMFYVSVFLVSHATVLAEDPAFDQAIKAFEGNRFDLADSLFQDLWQENGGHAETAFYLGRIAFGRKDFEQASGWFEKAIEIADTSARYPYWLGNAAGMQAMHAGILSRISLAKKTKKYYEKAVDMDPDYLDARWGLLQYYAVAPGIMGGSDDRALEQVEEIRRRDPVQGVHALAFVYRDQGKWDQLVSVYEDGIRNHPDEKSFYLSLYRMHMEKKEFEDAYELTERFIMRYPADAQQARFYQVMIFQEKQDFDAAFALLDTMIQADSLFMPARYQMGRTAVFSKSRFDQGIANLRIYLEHEPGPGEPQRTHACCRLGQIYTLQGDKAQAERMFRQSLALDPGNEEAKKALEALD